MDTARRYKDSQGELCSIRQMVKREPHWAAVRIQAGEEAIKELAALREAVGKVFEPGGIAGLVREAMQELEEAGEDV